MVWLPRTASGNSTRLAFGAGPVPLAAAATAWTSVATAFTEATSAVTHVMGGLGVGWEGEAATGALARLTAFLAWSEKTAALAAAESAKAAAQSTLYSGSVVLMPTRAEITAVKATVAASYGAGGALNGGALAAEAADRALDVRAALVMEGYEAASSHLAVSTDFDRPPSIVTDASPDGGSQVQDARTYQDQHIRSEGGAGSADDSRTRPSSITSPAQAAASAFAAATQNPAFASAAGQVGSATGSVASSGMSTVASAASNIGSAVMNPQGGGSGAAGPGGGSTSASVSPASTRPVSAGGSGSGFGGLGGVLGAGSAVGIGSGLSGGGTSAGLSGADKPAAPLHSVLTGQSEGTPLSRGGSGGAPMAGARNDEDEEHRSASYLGQFEHFTDGRTVAPSVIGAEPSWTED